jgi:hypothetical protein
LDPLIETNQHSNRQEIFYQLEFEQTTGFNSIVEIFLYDNPFNNLNNTSPQFSISSSAGETIINLPPTNFNAFLPIITSSPAFNYDENSGDYSFTWNTNGVSAGEYYLCGEFDDGLNSNTFCSSVPVILY